MAARVGLRVDAVSRGWRGSGKSGSQGPDAGRGGILVRGLCLGGSPPKGGSFSVTTVLSPSQSGWASWLQPAGP